VDRSRNLGDRVARNGVKARAHQLRVVDRVDDEEPVAELVEPDGIEVERPVVRLVEREDAAVAVALAEQGGEAHELDELLVRAQVVESALEPARRSPELLLGYGVPRVRVNDLDALNEQPQVRCRRGGRRRDLIFRAASRQRKDSEDHHRPAHGGSDGPGGRRLGRL
jgi:hypothetical protein